MAYKRLQSPSPPKTKKQSLFSLCKGLYSTQDDQEVTKRSPLTAFQVEIFPFLRFFLTNQTEKCVIFPSARYSHINGPAG